MQLKKKMFKKFNYPINKQLINQLNDLIMQRFMNFYIILHLYNILQT